MLNKLIFLLKRPKTVVAIGRGRADALRAISLLAKKHRGKMFILGSSLASASDVEDALFFLKHASLPVLVATHIGKLNPDGGFSMAPEEEAQKAESFLRLLYPHVRLVLNFDDPTLQRLKTKMRFSCETFGFGEGADFRATDIFTTQDSSAGTNFKINHGGKIVPVWLKGVLGKEEIYAALAAAAVGAALGLNLVEISQALSEGENKDSFAARALLTICTLSLLQKVI